MGCILISFGAAFTFVIVYTVITEKGIPWSVATPDRVRSGVLDRRTHPVGFGLLAVSYF